MRRESRRFLLPYYARRFQVRACSRSGSGADLCCFSKDPFCVLHAIFHFLRALYNPEGLKELIRWGGAPLVCVIIFIETGFFVGFFLPGDSLLVTAGIFAAAGVIPLRWILIPGILCAIAGDQVGYWIGRAAGNTLYTRKDSFLFRRSHLERARAFYHKHGGKTVILARFVPIVRTFCPPVTGAAAMSYPIFVAYDIFGGLLWVSSMILGGYFLGRHVPNIEHRIHYVIAAVILLSISPGIIGILRARHQSSLKSAPATAANSGNA
jgi:membrane-associated protein